MTLCWGRTPFTKAGMSSVENPNASSPSFIPRSYMYWRIVSPRILPASARFAFDVSAPVEKSSGEA